MAERKESKERKTQPVLIYRDYSAGITEAATFSQSFDLDLHKCDGFYISQIQAITSDSKDVSCLYKLSCASLKQKSPDLCIISTGQSPTPETYFSLSDDISRGWRKEENNLKATLTFTFDSIGTFQITHMVFAVMITFVGS